MTSAPAFAGGHALLAPLQPPPTTTTSASDRGRVIPAASGHAAKTICVAFIWRATVDGAEERMSQALIPAPPGPVDLPEVPERPAPIRATPPPAAPLWGDLEGLRRRGGAG